MRMIVAIIRPDTLKAVEESLDASDFSISVMDIKVRAGQEEVVQLEPLCP